MNVISTALEHYNIKAPSFKYYCTLKLAFKRLELKSYALENIMNYLNIKYDAHNALEDAKASYELFKYLNSIRKITPLDERIYSYNRREFNQLNRECVENINNLYGMCQALNYKENITQNQLSLFEKWLNENFENREYTIFNGILTKLEYFVKMESITKQEKRKLIKSVSFVRNYEYFSEEEINYQIFNGLFSVLNCDGNIDEKEYAYLKKWISYYNLPEYVDKEEILSNISED